MTEYIKAKEYLKAQCEKRKDSLVLEMPQNYIIDVEQAFLDGYHECEKEHEWHDLEKDPNDLPKDNKQYLVMFRYNYKGKAEERYGVRDNLKDDFAVHRCYTEQIIKWKEIE